MCDGPVLARTARSTIHIFFFLSSKKKIFSYHHGCTTHTHTHIQERGRDELGGSRTHSGVFWMQNTFVADNSWKKCVCVPHFALKGQGRWKAIITAKNENRNKICTVLLFHTHTHNNCCSSSSSIMYEKKRVIINYNMVCVCVVCALAFN